MGGYAGGGGGSGGGMVGSLGGGGRPMTREEQIKKRLHSDGETHQPPRKLRKFFGQAHNNILMRVIQPEQGPEGTYVEVLLELSSLTPADLYLKFGDRVCLAERCDVS